MAKSDVRNGSFLGFQCQGDIGPMTYYTQFKAGKKTIVGFAKVWLSDPTTLRQLNHRNRIRAAAAAWQRLTPTARLDWQRAARKCKLRLNGYALWTYWNMTQDRPTITTIERQSHIPLLTQ